jgi:D-alanyl-D-alanine carboxypeptidase
MSAREKVSDGTEDIFLILVNADHPLPNNPPNYVMVSAYGKVPLMTADIALEENTLAAVMAMFQGAKKSGMDTLIVTDGFRSDAAQQRLYNAAADKSFVQLPGCSEHQTGLAADIGAEGVPQAAMWLSAEGRWLAENAWRYGLILRYPQDKTAITGIAFEPWHFRYVSVEHARYMYENNLCLEEYLNYLNGE